MTTQALADARGAQWTKAIFNASTNPVGALTGLAHGEICDFELTRRLITGLIDECKAVADALGIELDHDPEDMVDHAARVAHDHKATMTQDVLAHRQTEIDFLNGAIVERGEEQGHPRPAQPRDLGARESIGGLVEIEREIEGKLSARPRGDGARGRRRARRLGQRVHGLRRRGHVHVRLQHRPPLRVRARPAEGDPAIVFPSEARYVGFHDAAWVDERVFVDTPGAGCATAAQAPRAWASTGSTTS